MAYTEWLSQTSSEPVWEGTKHPPATRVDDRYIWFIKSTTTLTPLNSRLSLGFSKDNNLLASDPPGTWTFSDETVLKDAGLANGHARNAQNLKIGVADLTFTPTDTTLHPITWRFGTSDASIAAPVWNGTQPSTGRVGDKLTFKWTGGVAPFTIKTYRANGSLLRSTTTSGNSYELDTANMSAEENYFELYDSNGSFMTTSVMLSPPAGNVVITNGGRSYVDGVMAFGIDVSNGVSVDLEGSLPVTAYGDAITSVGSQIELQPSYDIEVRSGETVKVSGRIGASYLLLSTGDIPKRYLRDEKGGLYTVYMLTSQQNGINFHTAPRPNEPDVGLQSAEIASGESATVELTGHNSFTIKPVEVGESQVQLDGGSDGATSYLNVIVVDEYPDTVLIKNGADVSVSDPEIFVNNPYLLNNNSNSVNVKGVVILGTGEGISISPHVEIEVSKDVHMTISQGTRATVIGQKVISKNYRVDNGTNVQVKGLASWSGDISNSTGAETSLTDGHVINTSGGSYSHIFGWKEQPHHEIVVNGSNVEISAGQIIVNADTISTRNGSSVHIGGQRPADISVRYRAVTSVFRGIQIERSDIIIDNPATITLTGTAFGGTLHDVATPCLTFYASMVPGREFVKGQFTEIPEISLDSSIRLGVKLYSCDNILLNPTTFASAYFTFDDELQLFANIDPVESIIYLLATPADLLILMRKKVYDVRLHVVDKQGNPSIVLTRKLRFI